jgi:hypothetical protein
MSKLYVPSPAITSLRFGRKRWVSALALTTALAANGLLTAEAHAQGAPPPPSLQGTFSAVGGSATLATGTFGGGKRDTITVNQATAVVNWTPTDTSAGATEINFLANGDSAVFQNGAGINSFTILNRIIPVGAAAARRIGLNGSIIGRINGVDGAAGSNIWFYTPNGFLIGATARFNMGGLTISSLDHPFNPTTGALTFSGTGASQWGLTAPAISGSSIEVADGAQFNLTNQNSYLALISPRVVQGGTADVNGSVAYVAAESVTMSLQNGLFDIDITQGTSDANGIVHTGTTRGAAPLNSNDRQAIAMVAIPKNTALTMLVSGTVGYQPASSALFQNGSIILSAGVDRANLPGGAGQSTATEGNAPANISITGGTLTSTVDALATGTAQINVNNATLNMPGYTAAAPSGFGTVTVVNGMTLAGKGGVSAVVGAGGTINLPGSLVLDGQQSTATGTTGAGSPVSLAIANGGQMTVGNLLLDASSRGSQTAASGASATGGAVSISVTGAGSRLTSASTGLFSTASGGSNIDNSTTTGGSGTGGAISITVNSGATAALGDLSIGAAGAGYIANRRGLGGGPPSDLGSTPSEPRQIGGAGAGGTVSLSVASNGAFSAETLTVDVSGTGGIGSVTGGNGTGGSFNITGNSGTIDFGPPSGLGRGVFDIVATGLGGSATGGATLPGNGGTGTGGVATIALSNGHVLNANGTLSILTSSRGGISSTVNGVDGTEGAARQNALPLGISASGAGTRFAIADGLSIDTTGAVTAIGNGNALATQAGNATLEANAGGAISIGGLLLVDASARGERDQTRFIANSAAQVLAGNVQINALGGQIDVGGLDINASGSSNTDSTSAGARAIGGRIDLLAQNQGALAGAIRSSGDNSLQADAQGGSGANGTNATGGTIAIVADQSTINLNNGSVIANTIIAADGRAGFAAGGTAGVGRGGTILIETRALTAGSPQSSTINFGSLSAQSIGRNVDNIETVQGDGRGGNASGGTITLNALGGAISSSSINLRTQGIAGSGNNGFTGGRGDGGAINVTVNGGDLTVAGNFTMETSGSGGKGDDGEPPIIEVGPGRPEGSAGRGVGGTSSLIIQAGTLNVGTLDVSSSGIGGDQPFRVQNPSSLPKGGTGQGGTAAVTVSGTGALSANIVSVSASGNGGDRGNAGPAPGSGGDGVGGNASLIINGGTADINTLFISAAGTGANGRSGTDVNGDGGSGSGGTASFQFNSGTMLVDRLSIGSVGQGGVGAGGRGNVVFTTGGTGGNATAGSASVKIGTDPTVVSLTIDVSAFGGAGGNGATGGDGGSVTNGPAAADAVLNLTADTLDVTSLLSISANAVGGAGGLGSAGAGGNGGNAAASDVLVSVAGATTALNASAANLNADAIAGRGGVGTTQSGQGGSATGGTVRMVTTTGGTVSVTGSLAVSALAQGGSAGDFFGANSTSVGAAGGNATGGAITVGSTSLADGSITTASLSANASATGGNGANLFNGSVSSGTGGNGGAAIGGGFTITANVPAGGSSFAVTQAALGGNGGAGDFGGNGGSATGGPAGTLNVRAGTASTLNSITIDSTSTGGAGGAGGLFSFGDRRDGNGGLGTGANATFNLLSGDLTAENLALNVSGSGGNGFNGGNGQSGNGSIIVTAGTLRSFRPQIIANGTGGNASNDQGNIGGNGGSGIGGLARLFVSPAARLGLIPVVISSLMPGRFSASASGTGGQGGSPTAGFDVNGGQGGAGVGGSVSVDIGNAFTPDLTNPGALDIEVFAQGGAGGASEGNGVAGWGGTATGGKINVKIAGGVPDFNTVSMVTSSIGGAGGNAIEGSNGGAGGAATGGAVNVRLATDPTWASLTISSDTTGGAGGTGVVGGAGGNAINTTTSGFTLATGPLTVGTVSISAASTGGAGGEGSIAGGSGGAARGGNVELGADGTALSINTSVTLNSSATGGAVGATTDLAGTGLTSASGGSATGGNIAVFTQNGGTISNIGQMQLLANAIGQNGAAGLGGLTQDNGGSGGSATGGAITVDTRGGSGVISNIGSLIANASGVAGSGGAGGLHPVQSSTTSVGGAGGSANGGAIFVNISGVNNTDAALVLDSSARAGNGGSGGTGGNAGLSAAGNATLRLTGNNVGDLIRLNTSAGDGLSFGRGGDGRTANGGTGGSAVAGNALLLIEQTGTNVAFGDLDIDASAAGGRGGSGRPGASGGNATAGRAIVTIDSNGLVPASLTISNTANVRSNAAAGAGGSGINGDNAAALVDGANGGNGGLATGGTAAINLLGSDGSLSINTLFALTANSQGGVGGDAGDGFNDSSGGAGGNGGVGGIAQGGAASINQDSGTLTITNGITPGAPTTISANSFGGSGGGLGLGTEGNPNGSAGRAAAATGGAASIVQTGGTINTPGVLISADGTGGGGVGPQIGQGGNGTGGTARLLIGGTFNSGNVSTRAIGTGGSSGSASSTVGVGANGGTGQGGTAFVSITDDSAILNVVGVAMTARGIGSAGGSGNLATGVGGIGGDGIGGAATLDIGDLAALRPFAIDISGIGGNGGNAAIGGDGGKGLGGGQQSGDGLRLMIGESNSSISQTTFINRGTGGAGGIGLNGRGGLGGQAIGGNVNIFSSNGGTVTFGQNFVDVSAIGGAGGSATNGTAGTLAGGQGGEGRGGNILFQASNGSTLVLNAGQGIIATGIGGSGGSGNRSIDSDSGAGGVGGSGNGGTISVVGETSGVVDIVAFSVNVDGFGGQGGTGGAGRLGTSAPLIAAANGTNGVNGINGANAGALGLPGLAGTNGTSGTNGANGISGGDGGNGGEGGQGGTGSGGSVLFSASTASEISMGNISASAAGIGGAGGIGGVGGRGGNGQAGGAGGNGGIGGSGGTGGPGANFGAGPVPAGAGGAAGNGGNGGNGGFGGAGGIGGNGGNAGQGGTGIGGTVSLIAVDSTTTAGTLALTTNGSGGIEGTVGLGGLGGVNASGGLGGTAGTAGVRGAGGIFIGGGPSGPLGAAGTNGIGGISRNFSPTNNFGGVDGNPSLPSEGAGGSVLLRVENGALGTGGSIDANAVTSSATGLATGGLSVGGSAGTIQIQNANAFEGAPTITLNSLISRALGSTGVTGNGGIEISTIFNPIRINGPIDLLTTENITISAVGEGKIVSTGFFSAQADGIVSITHDQKPVGANTIEAPSIFIRGDQGIIADLNATLRSTSSINLQSIFGNISTDELFSVDSILAEAGGNILVRDATTTGVVTEVANQSPLGGSIILRAGVDAFSPTNYFFGSGNITGTVTATGTVSVFAAQAINVSGTGNIQSDNDISLQSGDDISIADGARITSARAPAGASLSGILLDAGALETGFTPTGNAAVLTIGRATLSAANSTIDLQAGLNNSTIQFEGMIDGFNGTYLARSVNADVTAFGGKSIGLGGRIGAVPCIVGGVCLGSIAATEVNLGGSAGFVGLLVPGTGMIFEELFIASQGEVRIIGEDFAQSTLTATTDFIINAGGALILDAGLVDLPDGPNDPERFGNLTLTGGSNRFEINAASIDSIVSNDTDGVADIGSSIISSLGGNRSTGVIAANGLLELSVTDVNLGEISAASIGAGPLTFGNFAVDSLSVNDAINISAGNIAIGNATGGDGTDVTLDASGSIQLQGADAFDGELQNINLTAVGAIAAQNINAAGTLTANGNGVDLFFSNINQGIDVDASSFASIFGVFTGGTLDVDAGGISIVSTNAGAVNANGGSIFADAIETNGDVNLNAFLNVETTGNINASGRVGISATTGTVITGNVSGNSGVSITGDLGVTAGTISSSSGDIDITSLNGAITTGNITSPLGSVSLTNSLSSITTGIIGVGNDFTLTTGSSLNLGGVTAGDDIRITTTSDGEFGRLMAMGTGTDGETDGSNIQLTIDGSLFVDHAEADGNFIATAADFETGPNTIITGGDIIINTTGDVLLGNSEAGGLISVGTNTAISFGTMQSGSRTTLIAGTTIAGTALTAGGDIIFRAPTSISVGSLSTTGVIGDGNIFLISDGAIGLNTANARSMIGVRGTDITGTGSWTAGEDLLVLASGTTNLGALNAGDNLTVVGAGPITIGSANATGLGRDDRALSFGTLPSATFVSPPTFLINTAAADGGDIGVGSTGGGIISTGALSASDDITLITTGDIITTGLARTLGTGTTGGASNILASGANVSVGSANAATNVNLLATGTSGFASLVSGGTTTVQAAGQITGGSVAAGGAATLTSTASAIDTGAINGSAVTLNANTTINSGDIAAAATDISLTANGAITTGNLTALTGSVSISNVIGAITAGLITVGNDFTLNTGNDINFAGVSAGDDIRITTGGNAILADLASRGTGTDNEADGSNIVLNVAGNLSAANVVTGGFLEARGGTVNVGNVTSGTDAILTSLNGGLTVGNVTAGDEVWLSVFNSAPFALNAGTIRSTGLGSDTAESGPSTFGDAGPTGNVIRIRSSGAVVTGDITSTDRIIVVSDLAGVTTGSLSAGAGGIAALASTSVDVGAVTTTGQFIVRNSLQFPLALPSYQISALAGPSFGGASETFVSGPVTLGAVSAGALVLVEADAPITYNSITATGDINLETAASAGNAISGGALSAGQLLRLFGSSDASFTSATAGTRMEIVVGGTVSGILLTAPRFEVSGPQGINISTIRGGGTAASFPSILESGNGAITILDLQSGAPLFVRGRSVNIAGTGALTFNTLVATAGDVNVRTNSDLTVSTPGQLGLVGTSATGALTLNARGTATINGTVTGATINISSSDIVIAPTAQIGAQGVTTTVSLTNIGNRQTYIGGTGGTGTFGLSNAEAQRIFANNISIIVTPPNQVVAPGTQGSAALNTNTPTVILDTLTLTGAGAATGATAGNIGASGTLLIQTPGKLSTIGVVTLTNLTNNNRFNINASDTIEVDQRTGSIALRDANGGLAGTLGLTSQDVFAGTPTALSAVIAAPDIRTINDRLSRNDSGVLNDVGSFSANGIVVNVQNGFYIQNTGATPSSPALGFDQRRGFTVGAGGLQVTLGGPTAKVVISGRQVDALGGFVTGLRTIPLVSFAGSATGLRGLFDPGSTINGCAILTPTLCSANFDQIGITRDTINRNADPDAVGLGMPLPFGLIQLKDVEELGYEPIIDDPVTGAGNDDLWSVDDEEEEEATPTG